MTPQYDTSTTLPDATRVDPRLDRRADLRPDLRPDPRPDARTDSPADPRAVDSDPAARRRGLPRVVWIIAAVLALVVLVIIVAGILSRAAAEHALRSRTDEAAVPTVAVTHPTSGHLSPDIALPGNTQAYVDTPIYARTNGYLKNWFFDIGARVRKGQLMATIETPEVDQQLQVAQADLRSSQANLNLAQTTATRYQNLLKLDSVSKQETDQATSDALARHAAVEASEAAVRRLQQLQSFERIYAPFDGIVTARNTDIGALINAGSGSAQPSDLFRLAAIGQIRVFVPVPEAYSTDIVDGSRAYLTLDEYPGQRFEGRVTRNSNAIDPNSRTLNIEVDVPNPKGQLLPGAYAFVHFVVPPHSGTLTLPANTLLFRAQGLQVGVVRGDRVHLVPVRIAHDGGATVEVDGSLTAGDNIILDPSDSLADGQQVHVATANSSTGAPPA